MSEIHSTVEGIDGQHHTFAQSIALHLLPGLLFIPVFLIAGKFTDSLGLPKHLAPILIAVGLVIIPFELGYLLYEGKKRNGKFSLQGVILYRQPIPRWQLFVLGLPMLFWAAFIFLVVAPPVDSFFIGRFFSWMPESFFPNTLLDNLNQYSRTTLLATGIAAVILVGFVGPAIEELYFRGYLLPRLALQGSWAPIANILLFSLYHFWSPWQYLVRILAFSPLYFAVWKKKNVLLGIIWHVVPNVLSALGLLAVLLGAG